MTTRICVSAFIFRCLEQVGKSGECANEFLGLYKRLIAPAHWKVYLAVKGVLQRLGALITQVRHLLSVHPVGGGHHVLC